MSTFNLAIITPEGTRFEGAVESVVVPGVNGLFGVLAHHAPMVSALATGVLTVTQEGQASLFVVSGGVAEVTPEGVTVLADQAVKATDPGDVEQKLEELRHGRKI